MLKHLNGWIQPLWTEVSHGLLFFNAKSQKGEWKQPSSQVLASPHPRGSEGRKTGHISPKEREMTKKQPEKWAAKALFVFPELTIEGKILPKSSTGNRWKIIDFPYPVGKTATTSLPKRKSFQALYLFWL